MHHQNQRARRQHLFTAQFHADRQRSLEWRIAVAARRERLVAPDADQPHTEVAHRALDPQHRVAAQVAGVDVAQENRVERLHAGKRAGQRRDVAQFNLELCAAQGVGQRRVAFGVGRDDQHARIASHVGKTGGAVVLRDAVAVGLDLHLVRVEPCLAKRLREAEKIFALGQAHRLFAEQLVVAEEPHLGRLVAVGQGKNSSIERLAFFHHAGHGQALDRHIAAALRAQRHDVHRHVERLGRHHRLHGVADVFIAVGEKHEPLLAGLRERRRAEANGPCDIGAIRTDDGLDGVGLQGDRREGQLDAGVGAEHHQAGLVGRLFLGGGEQHVGCALF